MGNRITVLGYRSELFEEAAVTARGINDEPVPAYKCRACGRIFVGSTDDFPPHDCTDLREVTPRAHGAISRPSRSPAT